MSIASLINRPCRLTRSTGRTVVDDFGNRVPETETVDTVVELQQQRRSENDDEVSSTAWVAFFLPGEQVGTGDVLVADGLAYQVEGDPWQARNPRTQTMSHIEATVVRVAGADDEPESP